KVKLLASLGFALLLPSLCLAGTACGTATVVPADGRIVDFDFVANGTSNFYQYSVVPGRSYSVEVRQDYDDPNTDLTTSLLSDTGCSTPVAGSTDPSTAEPFLPANSFRRSFTAPGTGTTPSVFKIQVANGGSAGRYISVSVSDTTFFNPNWSTFSNYVTQWSFQNTTNAPINGKLVITDTDGTPTAGPFTLTFVIPANGKASKIIAGVPGFDINAGPQHGGASIFTYDGPPGAILATAYFINPNVNPANIVPAKFEPVRHAGR